VASKAPRYIYNAISTQRATAGAVPLPKEIAENGKDRGTANNMLCELLAEIALPLLLNPPSAVSVPARRD
jgi:hypothetical protein